MSDPIFSEEISDFWSKWLKEKDKYENLLTWRDKAKQHFKRIAIARSTTLRKIKRNEHQQLERNLKHLQHQASTGTPDAVEKYLIAKEKLKQYELQDLEGVKLRSKARFLEEGEKSSQYFYSLEKKQVNHMISSLMKDNEETVTDTYDIIVETRQFYKQLYTAEPIDIKAQVNMFNTYPLPTLPDKERIECDTPLTEGEPQQALSSMENNKSPGIDGLTTNFYKHFWNVFGSELTRVYNYDFSNGTLSSTQRRGVITLLFKKGDHTRLKNCRPITLLTTDYKILTKALANRLKTLLRLPVHSSQTACTPGSTINGNVCVIRDAINYANEVNVPLAIVSIDQLKAFDQVPHSFLFKTIANFGFGPNFIHWIETIYNSVKSTVKVNGWLPAFIDLERGLRQGCALSMPLYILTAEVMATHIRANASIFGLVTPTSKQETKLSQYADDTTFLL